jgi:hypothetical protein
MDSITIKPIRCERTNSFDTVTSVIELAYEIREGHFDNKVKILALLNGPTGYESLPLTTENIAAAAEYGWVACIGTPKQYDKVFVPADEIRRVLQEEGLL